jgi:hypothetical protein
MTIRLIALYFLVLQFPLLLIAAVLANGYFLQTNTGVKLGFLEVCCVCIAIYLRAYERK